MADCLRAVLSAVFSTQLSLHRTIRDHVAKQVSCGGRDHIRQVLGEMVSEEEDGGWSEGPQGGDKHGEETGNALPT